MGFKKLYSEGSLSAQASLTSGYSEGLRIAGRAGSHFKARKRKEWVNADTWTTGYSLKCERKEINKARFEEMANIFNATS